MLWVSKRRFVKSDERDETQRISKAGSMRESGSFLNDVALTILSGLVVSSLPLILYLNGIIALATLKLSVVILFILFVIGPLVFKYSYGFQRSVIFLNFVNWPKNPNYSNPSQYGLEGSRNLYLINDQGIKLGVWHILPDTLANKSAASKDDKLFDSALNDGHDVILYNHGNSGNRAAPHRIELYKVLRKQFHVIAFDYRSYGDSSNDEPSELGLVEDSIFLYKWITNKTSSKVFVWGHSLGTGVSTHALSVLAKDNLGPVGLILESPFNNMMEEISEHPLSAMFRPLPWFHYTIVQPMKDNGLRFANDEHLLEIDCPVLILHAEDDRIVPHKLGYKLYQTATDARKSRQGSRKFVSFLGKFNYGHKYICRAPELFDLIMEFRESSVKEAKDLQLL